MNSRDFTLQQIYCNTNSRGASSALARYFYRRTGFDSRNSSWVYEFLYQRTKQETD